MRTQLEQLVEGAELVVARDRTARAIAVPLLGVAVPAGVDPIHLGAIAGLAEWAPSDRRLAARTWGEALSRPGELLDAQIGMYGPGGIRPCEVRFLNLLDDPDVGAMLIAVTPVGPFEPAPAEPPPAERHVAPTWIMQRLDEGGRVLGTEGMVHELLGRPPGEVVDRFVIDFVHPDDLGAAADLWNTLATEPGSTRSLVHRVVHPDGGWRWVESTVMHRIEQTGEILVIAHDVTERIRREQELEAAAATDPLTGLPNRREVVAELERRLDDLDDTAAVLFVDLDGFKVVNDLWGHRTGDWALQVVADRLRESVRPGDVVGRGGGDEFVVVCRGVDEVALDGVVQRIRGALAPAIPLQGSAWRPHAAIGAARSLPGDDVEALLHRADEAMYEVKRSGQRRRADDLTRWSHRES